MVYGVRFLRVLKNRAFCKVDFTLLFREDLNNRTLFNNIRYCPLAEIAVILHSIKIGPF